MSDEPVKIVPIKQLDSDALIPRLERLLELAKENRIHDFAAAYYQDGDPSYCISYRVLNRIKLIGLLAVLQRYLADLVEVE